MGQNVEFGRVGTAVERFYADTDIFRRRLSVLDEDVEIPVVIEDAGIQQLELRSFPSPAALLDQLLVRIFPLRILVEHTHVAMGGGVIEVEPILFYILAMISFAASEAEHALFQNGIAAVPKCQCKNQQLIPIANPGNTILAPAIGLAACLIMGKKIPSVPVRTIVLPNSSPGPVADVGPPFPPWRDRADGMRFG